MTTVPLNPAANPGRLLRRTAAAQYVTENYFPCSPKTSNNFLQELDTLCPSHTDLLLLGPRVCARGRLREKAVKLLHGRGTLRLCPSHTDFVTLTPLCKSEASVKLLHGLGPRGHVMPLSHGLASGSMHLHEPLCFFSLVYEF